MLPRITFVVRQRLQGRIALWMISVGAHVAPFAFTAENVAWLAGIDLLGTPDATERLAGAFDAYVRGESHCFGSSTEAATCRSAIADSMQDRALLTASTAGRFGRKIMLQPVSVSDAPRL